MPAMDDVRHGGRPLDPFLHAAVGEDRNGNTVTVLSTLARLGLEPWDVAGELADLTREEARIRLGGFLARSGDVPALGRDHGTVTQRLIDLLPKAPGRTVQAKASAGAMGILPMLAVLMLILFLIQTLFLGSDGAGN